MDIVIELHSAELYTTEITCYIYNNLHNKVP